MTIALPDTAPITVDDIDEESTLELLRHFTITMIENGAQREPGSMRIRDNDVEPMWLPYIAPNAMLFARKAAAALATDGKVAVRVEAWAAGFGIGPDELLMACHRLVRFGLARWSHRDTTLLIESHWPKVAVALTTPEHRAALAAIADRADFYLDTRKPG